VARMGHMLGFATKQTLGRVAGVSAG